MEKREKVFAGVAILLGVLYFGQFGFFAILDEYNQLDTQVSSLTDKISDNELTMAKIKKKLEIEKELEARSLPTNMEVATSLYQNWLDDIAKESGLDDLKIRPNMEAPIRVRKPNSRTSIITAKRVSFSVNAKGSLSQCKAFLERFYSSGYLHKIKNLTMTPARNSRDLDLGISIEAASLVKSSNKDKLPKTEFNPLEHHADMDLYDQITDRNLFAEYVPPRPPPKPYVPPKPRPTPDPPPPPPPKPKFDVAKFAYLTAIIDDSGEPQIWINDRVSNKLHKLKVGETISIGTFEAKIDAINVRDITVTSEGLKYELALGKSLRELAPLP